MISTENIEKSLDFSKESCFGKCPCGNNESVAYVCLQHFPTEKEEKKDDVKFQLFCSQTCLYISEKKYNFFYNIVDENIYCKNCKCELGYSLKQQEYMNILKKIMEI
jgi:hypothetical protein